MSTASDSKHCPKCGEPIPAEAPEGLCPQCLLRQASFPTEAAARGGVKPTLPQQAELAAAFPQLEILELIGQGGMGFVFKARQPKLDRLVALKILPQSLAADPAFAERFTREGRLLARLNHPNIVTVHDFGQANGFFYLLMEYVDGVSLRQAMRAARFTPAEALAIVPKICEALQFAHNEGILHRDIKPENILLDSKGRVKIADFGIAKLVRAEGVTPSGAASPEPAGTGQREGSPGRFALTETGAPLGTPLYMAPEQLEHPETVDQRADVYSLGVVFYEMLTGVLPVGRFPPPSAKSSADPRLDGVVLRTLEREREHRTPTAAAVKTQVETITGGGSPADAETAWLQPAPATGIRSTRLKLAVAAALVFALIFVGGLVWLIPLLLKRSDTGRPAPVARLLTANRPFTKTVVLSRATTQLVGDSGDVRTVTVWSDTRVYPGEVLQPRQRLMDGEIVDLRASLFVWRSGHGTRTSSAFSWFFRDPFGEEEAKAAVAQLQQDRLNKPLVLTAGDPLPLFAVTNKSGGVMAAYLEVKQIAPDPPVESLKSGAKPYATVRLKPTGTLTFYSAEVPPGYALEATANWSLVGEGQASTVSPAGPYGYDSSWSFPSFGYHWEQQQEMAAQVQRLAKQGELRVVFGEPRVLFSVTNESHEVLQGMLELVGPPGSEAADRTQTLSLKP